MATQELHGLRPVRRDDDEDAIAALSDEERADLDAYARAWDHAHERGARREMLAICAPIVLIAVAILIAVGL